MLKRILSTVVLWTVILASLWFFGAHAAVVLLTLLSALTLWEFYALTGENGRKGLPLDGRGLQRRDDRGALLSAFF
ncbi:MAG: hypothetical protein WDM96_05545 [Lacunisphaera sp.]